MDDREKILAKLLSTRYTHQCPECNSNTYCAMEAGKSSNLCWCMTAKAESAREPKGCDTCLCKECL